MTNHTENPPKVVLLLLWQGPGPGQAAHRWAGQNIHLHRVRGAVPADHRRRGRARVAAAPERPRLEPKAIYERLEEYVIGQERAKKVLSVAVYNHCKRIWAGDSGDDDVELQKTNILLAGPSGCGKTLLAQTLARILDVPFCIADATSVTEAGYVGEDVENILLRLIQAADYDIAKAEQGIIYIDEVDKLGRKSANPSITRDVSGEGVQQALLKIIEGCTANVPPQGGRKHPHQELIQIKTDNILFICGGAFEGLDKIVAGRRSKEYQNMGFRSSLASGRDATQENALQDLIPEDLLAYGFIPEFVGRLPLVMSLTHLDKADLLKILVEPKNAVVKQYQRLFSLDDVDLIFTGDALEAAAEDAIQMKTGARGLRSINREDSSGRDVRAAFHDRGTQLRHRRRCHPREKAPYSPERRGRARGDAYAHREDGVGACYEKQYRRQ